jgi:D-arabinose 1-dehydrogenase-like Zn-dependent alcohol dehydrogenase
MKGRVIAFTGPRQPFEIHEFDVPEPEPGAIILKITQAGICGSDLHAWRGDDQLTSYGKPEPPGRTIGHEGTGLVYKLGEGVSTDSLGKPIKEGDRIIYSAINPCGRCHRCLNGNYNWCPNLRTGLPFGQSPYFTGTYADFYYIRPTQPVFKVPDELPDEVLGFVNCAMGTVTEGLQRARRQGRRLRRYPGRRRSGPQCRRGGEGHGRPPRHRPGPAGEPPRPGARVRRRLHDQRRIRVDDAGDAP